MSGNEIGTAQVIILLLAALNTVGTALALWILSMVERRTHRLETLAMHGRTA